MDFLALCPRGIEDFAAQEASEAGLTASPDVSGAISGKAGDLRSLLSFAYRTRLCNKVVLLLSRAAFTENPVDECPPDAAMAIPWLGETFSISVERRGEHAFSSQDIATTLGAMLSEQTGKTFRFKGAKTQLFALVHETAFLFGVDLCGFDLGRRDFRVFLRAESLRGTVAAGLLRIAQWTPKHTLLDPFCRDGVIPIEAALIAMNRSPHFYAKESFAWRSVPGMPQPDEVLVDKERTPDCRIISSDENFSNLSASKRNATVAGVVKSIEFSRLDLEWLDTKLEKGTIDRIISYPLEAARSLTPQNVGKIYDLFFERASFVLKKSGTLTLIVRRSAQQLKDAAQKHGFSVTHERTVHSGADAMPVLVFSRK